MKPKATLLHFLTLAGSSLLAISSASAQTAWDGGGGDSNYANNLNWAGDVIPGNGNNNGASIGNGSTQTVIYNTATSYTSNGTGKANSLLVGTGTSGVGSLTLSGSAGTLTFGGDSYSNAAWIGSTGSNVNATGSVTVSAGKLAITGGTDASINLGVWISGTPGGVKSGTLLINGGTVEVGRRILMGANDNNSVGILTISSGTLDMKSTGSSGEGDLGKIRFGAGNNTLNLDGGTVIFRGFHTSDSSSARSTIYMNGTTLRANAAITDLFTGDTTKANYRIKTGGLILDTNNFAVTINDNLTQEAGQTGILRKQGLGTLTMSATTDHTGSTTIEGGILSLTNANALQNSFINTTDSITGDATNGLRTNQTSLNLGGLSGNKDLSTIFTSTSGGYGSVTGITLNVATANSLSYSGVIDGTRTLTKTGAGSQTLSGASTYTGATSIQQGSLIAGTNSPSGANGAFGNATSDVTLGVASGNSAASLLTGGAFTIGRNIRNATTNTTDPGTRVLTLGGNTAHNSEFSGNIFLGTASQTSKGIQLTAAAGGQVTFSGVIQNPTGQDGTEAAAAAALTAVTKVGAGTVILSNANTYTGATAVNQGALEVSSTGSIANTSGITINTGGELKYGNNAGLDRNVTLSGGTFRYNASTAYSGTLTYNSGTLAGTNLTGTAFNNQVIGTNKSIAPGNSPGTMSVADQTWAPGGTYLWELYNATGTAGDTNGWDLLSGTGTLNITASLGSEFIIDLTTLASLSPDALGDATNFDSGLSYSWLIADFATVTGFDATDFTIDATGFDNAYTGTFGLSWADGATDQIFLTYTAVPEPSAALLGGLGILLILRRKR